MSVKTIIQTVKLAYRGNIEVLAKEYNGELTALTYANRKQAYRKAEILNAAGIRADVLAPSTFGRAFLVMVYGEQEEYQSQAARDAQKSSNLDLGSKTTCDYLERNALQNYCYYMQRGDEKKAIEMMKRSLLLTILCL